MRVIKLGKLAKLAAKKKVTKKRKSAKKSKTQVNITGMPITDKVIAMIKEKRCVIYPNNALHSRKYYGCGNGHVVIDKNNGNVMDFDYTEDGKIIPEQNIFMTPEAGIILEQSNTYIKVRANFSCGMACLF